MRLRTVVCASLCLLCSTAGFFSGAVVTEAKEKEEARVFELRTYTTSAGKLDDLHARFRDHTMKIFEKHGMKNVSYWTPTDKKLSKNTLVYVISHKNRKAADASWKAFIADPKWTAAYKDSIKDGKLVTKVRHRARAAVTR